MPTSSSSKVSIKIFINPFTVVICAIAAAAAANGLLRKASTLVDDESTLENAPMNY